MKYTEQYKVYFNSQIGDVPRCISPAAPHNPPPLSPCNYTRHQTLRPPFTHDAPCHALPTALSNYLPTVVLDTLEVKTKYQYCKVKRYNSPYNMPRTPRGGIEVYLYSFFNLGDIWGGWSTPRLGYFTPGRDMVSIV
jgi:hypothetical protein